MIALFAVLLSLTAAAAVAGDFPAPMDDDLEDSLRMSFWDYHRSQIRDDIPAPGGRTPKVGLDIHAAACAGHDGTDFECVCGLDDRGRP